VAGDDPKALALVGGRDEQRLEDAVSAHRLDELGSALSVGVRAGV
jgi:hypothetical protein